MIYTPRQPWRFSASTALLAVLVFIVAYVGSIGYAVVLDYATSHPRRCVEVGHPTYPGGIGELRCYPIAD